MIYFKIHTNLTKHKLSPFEENYNLCVFNVVFAILPNKNNLINLVCLYFTMNNALNVFNMQHFFCAKKIIKIMRYLPLKLQKNSKI